MSVAEWLSTPHAVTLAGWVWLIVVGILAGGVAAPRLCRVWFGTKESPITRDQLETEMFPRFNR